MNASSHYHRRKTKKNAKCNNALGGSDGSTGRRRSQRGSLAAPAVRVPDDYPWEVLRHVCSALSSWHSDSSLSFGLDVARRRNFREYIEGGVPYGLQSINRSGGVEQHTAALHRLVSALISKHEKVGLLSPAERKEKCLKDVISLDINLRYCPALLTDPVFVKMKEEMFRLLGSSPDLDEISAACRHGPGSSTDQDYEHRSKYFKYRDWPYSCSPGAGDLLRSVIRSDPRWVGALEDSYRLRYRIPPWAILNQDVFWKNVVFDEVPYNRITAVPKDGTKDRPIAIEPPGNVYLQLGIDSAFRRRLRAVGNPIDHQLRNRKLALEGSLTGRLATIDLSNASDTIHQDIVAALLPEKWYSLLNSVRSPYGLLPDGTAWRYAKMSSMGNATTFVLETAVFWAVVSAVSKLFGHPSDTFSVFGDDLIVPAYLYRHVVVYLDLMGCVVNEAKSFASGPIRESCGVDAYKGQDIRPVFLKRQPVTDLDIYADRNRIHLWWKRHIGVDIPCELDCFFFKFLKLEPLFGPETEEDVRSHLFASGFTGRYYEAYSERMKEVPAREFLFRKLMHTLRGSSEGGMFAVQEASQRLRVVRLVANL